MSEAQDIDAFVNAYWPEPHKFIYDDTYEAQDRKYRKGIREKYGKKVYAQYRRLENALNIDEDEYLPQTREVLEITDFVFKNRMCEDVIPETSLRGKILLKYLLGYLAKRSAPFTLADFGCGCGRMTAGLAAYADNVQSLYANDILQSGLDCMRMHIKELPESLRERARKRIIPVCADYCSDTLAGSIQPVDVALAVNPILEQDIVISKLGPYIKNDGELVICEMGLRHPAYADPCHDKQIMSMEENKYNSVACKYGLHFSALDTLEIVPLKKVIVFSGKKTA